MLSIKEFEAQYKNHLSGFKTWNQKDHADKWILFENNIGEKLSIDEIAVTNGELYTVVTNKKAKGGKGSLVAIVSGTKSTDVIAILKKIPIEIRNTVLEVTLDMSNAMDSIIKGSFPRVTIVTDRFHVQQLVSEAVQEIRILLRKKAIKQSNTSCQDE
jgi:transposase